MLLASHSLAYRVHTRVFFTLFVALAITVALLAGTPVQDELAQAEAAAKSGDHAAAISRLEAARLLRPDYPRILYRLARSEAAAGHRDRAVAALRSLSELGLALDPATDPLCQQLAGTTGFGSVAEAFRQNARPHGATATLAWQTSATDGIIEGLAVDSRGNAYLSDVRHRCLWRRDASGTLIRFSASADSLDGLFGLQLDEAHGLLWAAMSAVPEMDGYQAKDRGRAALVAFSLANGRVVARASVPDDGRDHVLGDLLLLPDGGVLATDSAAPVIWRLAPRARTLSRWLESTDFISLQGLILTPDRHGLVVADYANGLWYVSLSDQSHRLLEPPARTTFFGLDGLYATPTGFLGVQNGVSPQRILRVDLDGGRVRAATVLSAAWPGMDDLSLGALSDGRLLFIGDSGWGAADAHPSARPISVLSLPLSSTP